MKKMWKKNNKAVSPVIATILMVAITVVLAAVLYVMVMGFGGDGGGQAPTASLTNSGNRLQLSLSEAQTIGASMSLTMTINGTAINLGAADDTPAGFEKVGSNYYYNTTATHIVFVDAGNDGKISTGDYFQRLTGAQAVLIKVIWSSGGTNQVIAEGTI